MCNPRRIKVTVTREIAEAWQHEVSRTVALSAQVTGEARVCQSLSSSLGVPVLRALETFLDSGNSGWQEVNGGYRFDVEGGYAFYDMENQNLEITATLQDTVERSATASVALSGEVQDELKVDKEGRYYDDGYGGQTKERAERQAREAAQQDLDVMKQARLEQARQEAEAAEDSTIQAQAQAKAKDRLDQAAEEKRDALAQEAARHLDTVGVRCRQAFNTLMARSYRDAILAYARRNGAENISCQDGGEFLEIEFFMDK